MLEELSQERQPQVDLEGTAAARSARVDWRGIHCERTLVDTVEDSLAEGSPVEGIPVEGSPEEDNSVGISVEMGNFELVGCNFGMESVYRIEQRLEQGEFFEAPVSEERIAEQMDIADESVIVVKAA